jgi:hypothetical protein
MIVCTEGYNLSSHAAKVVKSLNIMKLFLLFFSKQLSFFNFPLTHLESLHREPTPNPSLKGGEKEPTPIATPHSHRENPSLKGGEIYRWFKRRRRGV